MRSNSNRGASFPLPVALELYFLFFTVNWDGEFAISALPWQFLGPSLKSLSAFFGFETRHNSPGRVKFLIC
jgi:hypothetical protein